VRMYTPAHRYREMYVDSGRGPERSRKGLRCLEALEAILARLQGERGPGGQEKGYKPPAGVLNTNPARCPLHAPRQPSSAVKLVTS
jgi:hypothetical protein